MTILKHMKSLQQSTCVIVCLSAVLTLKQTPIFLFIIKDHQTSSDQFASMSKHFDMLCFMWILLAC